ncbi:MAG TPA: hypothetical protein VL068_00770 [Microthrixaceae bacterium]|nr:hypothetical protein [Microthrixaceae bacterium]
MKPFTGDSSALNDLIKSSGLAISTEALAGATGSGMDSQYRFEPERVIGLLASSIAQVHATPLSPDSLAGLDGADQAATDGADPAGAGPDSSGPDSSGPDSSGPDAAGRESDQPGLVTPASLVKRAWSTLELPEPERPTLGAAYSHMSRERLVEIFAEGSQGAESRSTGPVLIQGTPTLGNLRFAEFELLGFADWSNACVADPYLDLALACRDILALFGTAPIRLLLEGYSSEPLDPVRLDWYTLATELVP